MVLKTNESEKQDTIFFVQTYRKKKEVPYMEMSRDNDQKRKATPYIEISRDNDKKHAYISSEFQLQIHSLTFIPKNKSLLSATSILSRSPMVYSTTVSWENLTCTDYVDFGKCQSDLDDFLGPKSIPTTWM